MVGPRRPYDGPWRKIRPRILERDGHTCQIRLPTCTGRATEVDHITPIEAGGAPYDPDNLRAACRRCNNTLRNRRHNADGWRRSPTHIVLVHGPPGAGKTTYVDQHKQPGDLIIDYDRIAQALGSDVTHGHSHDLHAAVTASRNALLTKLRRGEVNAPRAWIVSTNPQAPTMFPHHESILVDPGRAEVHARVDGHRPDEWAELIDGWYHATAGNPSREW